MKQTVKVLSAVALIFMIAACSKNIETPEVQENNQPEITGGKITESLIAKTENDADTKMAVDGLTSGSNYSWSVDTDKIAAFVTNDEGANYTKVESGAYNGSSFSLTYDEGSKRGGFAVYPYEFAKSYSSAGGLVVEYPDSYDISAYINKTYYSDTEKAYDVHSAYFPMPMIATSTDKISNLLFYSIGAMVRVKVSNIPVGTKVLYITFDQQVTGEFTIASPVDPGTSVVSATPGTSTVAYRIAAEESAGFTAADGNAIVLYIPVPVATDLSIASTTTTKTTVRNGGKSFAVNAITCTGDGSFTTNLGKYFVAPGNLLVSKSGGALSYSFEDPLKSTKRDGTPHTNGAECAPDLTQDLTELQNDEYQDVFTWPQMCTILSDGVVPDVEMVEAAPNKTYHFPIVTPLSVAGHNDWILTSCELMYALLGRPVDPSKFPGSYSRTGSKAMVGLNTEAIQARAIVTVTGSPTYASYSTSGEIPGILLFPDNYVDQTDAIQYVNDESTSKLWNTDVSRAPLTISLSAFEEMIKAGAVFLPAIGYYQGGWTMTCTQYGGESVRFVNDSAYVKDGPTRVVFYGTNIGYAGAGGYVAAAARLVGDASSVRLVREVVADGPSSSGEDRGAWGNLD